MLSLHQEQQLHHLAMTQGSKHSMVSTWASLLEPALQLSPLTVKVRVSSSSGLRHCNVVLNGYQVPAAMK
jgi:hypothetical protein